MFRMHGVVPPMITPFKENGEVDYPALKTLVTFLKDEVDGLFVNGSYGSGVMMTEEERKKVLEETIKTADGKVSIVAHVGTADSLSAAGWPSMPLTAAFRRYRLSARFISNTPRTISADSMTRS